MGPLVTLSAEPGADPRPDRAFTGRTLIVAGPGKPSEAELRRRIAADEMPDVVSAEDALGPLLLDDRYFADMAGFRGKLLRRLPLLAAQGIEVLALGDEYDAVLTWADRPAIVVGALLRLRLRRPAHVAILMWPSKAKKAALLRFATPAIDRFIVWPRLQRRFVEERLHIPPDRFVEARAPVDVDFWRPLDGPGDMICSVGQEMRDYATLVEALSGLEVPCHIAAGSGLLNTRFLEREWRANVGERALPANITVGRRSHTELRELYARSRFVVVPLAPSDMDNGITVILEAFAMGRAVICTETSGQTGVLEDGVNCLRVPPHDPVALGAAIARLWNDPDECGRLGAAGRRLVESSHGQDQWRATLVQAVTEAVGSRAGGGALRRSTATAPSRRGAEIDELTSLVFTSRQQKPPDAELRRRISADELPDTVSAEDMIGATVVDERYFEAMPGLRGRLLRRFPLLAAQAVELAFVGHRYDAIVAWGERHAAVLAAVLRLRRSRPGMVAILIWPSKSKRAARFVRLVRRELDRVIVPSPMQRRFAQERLGIPPRRFVEARYAVDTRFWRPEERDGDIICSAGQEMRDYGTLLEALRGLEIPCHIAAGQGLFDARFLTRDWDRNVGDRSIPSNVTVGRLPHAELRGLYARSRFVVVPILPSDNDSGITVILEAFAMGKAVICTDSPGQTGLLEPDVNCLRVPPEDPDALRAAILELWEDPERCNRLGAAGRAAVVERHGLDQWRAALMRAVAGAAPRNS